MLWLLPHWNIKLPFSVKRRGLSSRKKQDNEFSICVCVCLCVYVVYVFFPAYSQETLCLSVHLSIDPVSSFLCSFYHYFWLLHVIYKFVCSAVHFTDESSTKLWISLDVGDATRSHTVTFFFFFFFFNRFLAQWVVRRRLRNWFTTER